MKYGAKRSFCSQLKKARTSSLLILIICIAYKPKKYIFINAIFTNNQQPSLMKKIIHTLLLSVFLLLATPPCNAQENKKEIITKALDDYFFLERENIHVQCNKSIYITNEQVWFKGYVFHRKKNVPFFSTVNVFASLIDETGKIIDSKLLYSNIGSFSGNFKLNDSFKSGKYYIQFYTNWMNNFIEDESATEEITIINQPAGAGNALAGPDPSKINIDLHPEGGTMLEGTANIIGINVSDCNHNALAVSTVDIIDGAGKIVKTVQINKLGYGRLDLPADAGKGYKAVVTLDGVKHEQPLPQAQLKGIALEINSYATPDKTIVTLRTNKATQDLYGGKPLYLLAHKDDQAIIFEIKFEGKQEIKMVIANADLFDGMNTVRILDNDLNQLAERLIYKYPASGLSTQITPTAQNVEKLEYKGKVNYANMNLSISVLPENTRSLDQSNDIYSSFLLLPYIQNQKKANGKHYFTTLTKGKMYELDLFLLSQKSKYEWYNILKNPPKNSFPFDMGLTLKGTVPKSAGDLKYSKIRLYSLTSGIDETTTVDDTNGNFVYNNLLVPDSSYVNFTLLRASQKPKELTLAPQLLNNNTKFNKNFIPQPHCFAVNTAAAINTVPNVFKETTELKEVKIEASRLKYANIMGNGNLRGYKISEMKANMYQNLLNFIKTYGGFNVNDTNGSVTIYSRTVNSINGAQSSPIVYIDNAQVPDLTMLQSIQMSEVDEIYINAQAIVPSVRNYLGIIKIYLHKGVKAGGAKNTTPEILLKNGFEKITPFTNVNYNSTSDEGFANFGVIDWQPTIMTDENGEFKLSIPKTGQKSMKILIEGFSADGKLISEIKTIPIK